MKQVLNRRSAFAALMSMMIVLSSCGQTALPGNTQVNQPGQESQTLTLSEAGQANQTRTLDVAAARGLKVESYVTLDSDAGVPTTYVAATSADGQAVTLLGSVENGAPVFAELRQVAEGQLGTGGAPFSVTALTAQGTVSQSMSAQSIADWVYNRLVDLVNQYKRAPRWLKAALRGPLKGIIKLIIGEAINRGCTYAYDTLVRKLRADGRWVPLGRDLLCEILLG